MVMPAHEPTDDKRKTVMTASGNGLPHDLIAKLVGLDCRETLYKYYRHELDLGKAERGEKVVKCLAQKIDDGDTASIFFYCKTQLGWREKPDDDEKEKMATLQEAITIVRASKPDADTAN